MIVSGENANDSKSIVELVRALRTDELGFRLEVRKGPFLFKRTDRARADGIARKMAAVVRAEQVRSDVVGFINHEDTDALEPAHVDLADAMSNAMTRAGVPSPLPAIAAWEIEAWLWLWPDAIAAAFPSTRGHVRRTGQRVGMITDAKEAFSAGVSVASRGKVEYAESDAPRICAQVRGLGIVRNRDAVSDSFEAFADRVGSYAP